MLSGRRLTGLAGEIQEYGELCVVPEGALVGQPWEWLDFQLDFLEAVFNRDPLPARGILSVGRRNGKTAGMGVIVLASIDGPLSIPNSWVYSASRSKEQAGIIYNYAKKIVEASGWAHEFKFSDAAKQIKCLRTGCTYRALSADANTSVGYGWRLCIHDELGRVKGTVDELYDVLTTAGGSFDDSIELVISTQSESDGDLLSTMIDDARSGADRETVAIVHEAPKGCRLDDEEAWRAANPALGHHRSERDLRSQIERAMRLPARQPAVRNLLLNQRVAIESPFLTDDVWRKGDGPIDLEVFYRFPVYGGLDLSQRRDLTALVLVCVDDEDRHHVLVRAWMPRGEEGEIHARSLEERQPYEHWVETGELRAIDGAVIDYAIVAEEILELTAEMDVQAVAYDRWRIDDLRAQFRKLEADEWSGEFDEEGEELLVPYGQGFKDMGPAIDAAEEVAVSGRLRHGGQPVLRMAVAGSIVTYDPAKNRKLDKKKSTARIDPCVAWVMAEAMAARDLEGLGSFSDDEGLVTGSTVDDDDDDGRGDSAAA